jgi:hypothetical protein
MLAVGFFLVHDDVPPDFSYITFTFFVCRFVGSRWCRCYASRTYMQTCGIAQRKDCRLDTPA